MGGWVVGGCVVGGCVVGGCVVGGWVVGGCVVGGWVTATVGTGAVVGAFRWPVSPTGGLVPTPAREVVVVVGRSGRVSATVVAAARPVVGAALRAVVVVVVAGVVVGCGAVRPAVVEVRTVVVVFVVTVRHVRLPRTTAQSWRFFVFFLAAASEVGAMTAIVTPTRAAAIAKRAERFT